MHPTTKYGMTVVRRALSVIVIFIAVELPVYAQAKENEFPSIREWMTREEFRQSGLGKLTQAELAILDDWLWRFANHVAEHVRNESVSEQQPRTLDTPNVVESRIDGDFSGWEGETVFRLTNGQVWQQVQFAYRYHYAFMPKVMIVRTDAGYRMTVDGVSGSILVKRLR